MRQYEGTFTKAHLDHIRRICEQWVSTGLSTGPCDPDAAHAAACAAYKSFGLPEPRLRVWMGSPFAAVCAATAIGWLSAKPRQSGDQLEDQLRSQLGGKLWDQLAGQTWGPPEDQFTDRLWNSLEHPDLSWLEVDEEKLSGQFRGTFSGELDYQIRSQLGPQFYNPFTGASQFWDLLKGQLTDHLWGHLWGQLQYELVDQLQGQLDDWPGRSFCPLRDAFRLAHYQCGLPIAGFPGSPQLDALVAAVQAAGWWIPLRDATIMAGRPVLLACDRQGRLHSDSGMAVRYQDGWGFHARHGTRVP